MCPQANLNPSNEATDVKYKGHLETKFLINSDILYETICFGLADSDNKVSCLLGSFCWFFVVVVFGGSFLLFIWCGVYK